MLEKLDQVDWGRYSCTYGPATDLPDLLRALASTDPAQREAALSDISGRLVHQGTVWDATPLAVPFLIEILDTPGAALVEILGLLGCLAQGTGEEHDIRASRLAVEDGVPRYIALLDDPRPAVRSTVPWVLAACLERCAEAETALLRRIADEPDAKVKAAMVVGLTRLWQVVGPETPAGLDAPQRAGFLKDLMSAAAPPAVYLTAALGLAHIGLEPDETCRTVLRASATAGLMGYPDPPWTTCEAVQEACRAFASLPMQQREFIVELLGHPISNIRFTALFLAESVCREDRDAVGYFLPLFVKLLDSDDQRMREQALQIMLRLGSAPAVARDASYKAAVADASPLVRLLAVRLLGQIGDPRGIPLLHAMLDDPQTRPSGLSALETFETMGPRLAALVPMLRQLLKEKLESFWCSVVERVLAAIGPEARAATEDLIGLLDTPDEFVRLHAARALGQMGPDARAALPALVARLHDPDGGVRAQAALAVWQIDGRTDLAAPALLGVLNSRRLSGSGPGIFWGRIAAAEFIVQLRPPVTQAMAPLRDMLRQADAIFRVRAAVSLWKLGASADEVLPVLVSELKRTPTGLLALECLEEMGPLAAAAAPELRRQLADDRIVNDLNDLGRVIELDRAFRAGVARVLAGIGTGG